MPKQLLLLYHSISLRLQENHDGDSKRLPERRRDSKWPKLTACQYLRACINESMRIGPPGTSDLPREVLPGGITVDGNFFPAGTDIGCPLYSMYHKESHFPDPNVFRPERWIVDENTGVTAEKVVRSKEAFNPFQLGPGFCPGRALAINEQLIVIARALFLMDVKLAPGDDLGALKPEFG